MTRSDTLPHWAAIPIRHCPQSPSVLLWTSLPRPDPCDRIITGLSRPTSQAHLTAEDGGLDVQGNPGSEPWRPTSGDLRPMNLGLATAKRRAQQRSAWRKLVATATSSQTRSWRSGLPDEFRNDRSKNFVGGRLEISRFPLT